MNASSTDDVDGPAATGSENEAIAAARQAGSECLNAAITNLQRGWSSLAICPPDHYGVGQKHAEHCGSPGKAPWGPWKEFQDRLATDEELRKKWRDNPMLNVGMALGEVSGKVRLDVDGAEGWVFLREKCGGELPDTIEFVSGSGWHGYIFEIPPGVTLKTTKKEGEAIHQELRFQAKGAQTVLPPSRHRSGGRYRWVPGHGPDEIQAALMPLWMVELMRVREPEVQPQARNGDGHQAGKLHPYIQAAIEKEIGRIGLAYEGGRNDTVNKAAYALGKFVGGGVLDRAYVEERLAEAASRCGLGAGEAAATIKSGIEAGITKPRGVPSPNGQKTHANSDGAPEDTRVDSWEHPKDGVGQPPEADQPSAFCPIDAFDLMVRYPTLLPPIIDGLLREAEILNLIAATKVGKSWLSVFLAYAVAFGLQWLGFQATQGKVLIIDNELHKETIAYRMRRVAEVLQIDLEAIKGKIEVISLRGNLQDILRIGNYLMSLPPRSFKLVIIDAQYRTLPADVDENSNGQQAQFYNHLDRYAGHLRAGFVMIHHASKGDQSQKQVSDVGAGAGAMSRAADCHCVLRPHEEENVIVLDAVARSWPPVASRCLRWEFPLFSVAPEADPSALRVGRSRRNNADNSVRDEAVKQRNAADEMSVATCIDRITAKGEAATLTRVRAGAAPLSRARVDAAIERLRQADVIEGYDIMIRGGRGAEQSATAYRRRADL